MIKEIPLHPHQRAIGQDPQGRQGWQYTPGYYDAAVVDTARRRDGCSSEQTVDIETYIAAMFMQAAGKMLTQPMPMRSDMASMLHTPTRSGIAQIDEDNEPKEKASR